MLIIIVFLLNGYVHAKIQNAPLRLKILWVVYFQLFSALCDFFNLGFGYSHKCRFFGARKSSSLTAWGTDG